MLYDTSTMQPQFRYSNGCKMTGSSVLGHVAKRSTAAIAVLPSKSLIRSNRITSCMICRSYSMPDRRRRNGPTRAGNSRRRLPPASQPLPQETQLSGGADLPYGPPQPAAQTVIQVCRRHILTWLQSHSLSRRRSHDRSRRRSRSRPEK